MPLLLALPLAIATPVIWTALVLCLVASKEGRHYVSVPSRRYAQDDVAASQPEALTMVGLVFAGIALAGTDLPVMSSLLFVSLTCFTIVWAAAHWFFDFTVQLAGDCLRWTGVATMLAAAQQYAIEQDLPYAVGATVLALVFIVFLSWRGALAHWRTARSYGSRDVNEP